MPSPLIPAFLGAFALAVLTSCQAPSGADTPATGALSLQVGQGPATATVRVVAPGYATLQAAHKWVAGDVFQYAVTLQQETDTPGTFADLVPPRSLTLDQKGARPATQASFTGLSKGKYQAIVIARGNVGGTAPAQDLNGTGAVVPLDLSVDNVASGTATIVFPTVDVDFGRTVTLTPPASDGPFIGPSAEATASIDL